MKNLFTVFKFELFNLLNKKAFRVTTAIFCIAAILLLSIPTFLGAIDSKILDQEVREEKQLEKRLNNKFGIIVNNEKISSQDLKDKMSPSKLIVVEDREELTDLIKSEKIKAGFIVNSTNEYEYIVNNSSMVDEDKALFKEAMTEIHRNIMLGEKGVDYKLVDEIYASEIKENTTVLGQDNSKNYLATYILTFGLYFIILFYGQNTAVSVASEKSNRSMEILVTSTSTRSLIFGKVMANALVGIIQFGTILLVAFGSYKLNSKAWGDALNFAFDIPIYILINFALFGTLGYLLYLFIYSGIGALVSRTEDITTSATPVTLVYIVAFFISIIGLSFPSNIIVKIASYFPFTSFMAMFVRVSMSSVSIIEIIVSLLILLITTILVGIFSAKIYRLGTLRYGNPIKISEAFRMLKNK